jgi:hypothetical protein
MAHEVEQQELGLEAEGGAGSRPTANCQLQTGRRPLAAMARETARPDMVRVAPGRHAWLPADPARSAVSRHVLCRWSKQPDGTYAPVPLPCRLVRMTPETTAMLGFVSGNRTVRADTLLRLAAAGFIDCVRVSPHCWMLDLDSWFRHLADCLDDPEYWDEGGEARRRYNLANGLGVEHK